MTPTTRRLLFEQYPELRVLYEAEIESDDMFDLRQQLALAKVLVRHYVDQANLNDTDNSFGKTPPALAAIEALRRATEIAERILKIEERLGPITHSELKRYMQAVAAAFVRFVPRNQQDPCKEFIREQLMANAGGPGELGEPELLQ
ncbi:MAG: hypothetical protein HY699_12955 [Deltaproteobacteria bacterium]|nr:hypothetical protein [Deltaproteobacteria bacterium]